jgi:hypothetical protein
LWTWLEPLLEQAALLLVHAKQLMEHWRIIGERAAP